MKIIRNKDMGMSADISRFTAETAEKTLSFHKSFDEYEPTPLVSLESYAQANGIGAVFIKDESFRFGLNAFKVLGGSYAVASFAENLPEDAVFITATDGNHGRGVAWAASRLGRKSVVYMPRGTARERLDNILKLGSDASITDLPYDDAVRKAKYDAEQNGWILVQDTSWDGYEEVPYRIMQGYLTMVYEAVSQLGDKIPTHVFLQAGVGSMAAAVTAFLANLYKNKKPTIIIVEPDNANCIYLTAEAADGMIHSYEGEMNTIMAGLACGEPCTVAWDILKDYADYFASIPDEYAANGMRVLAHPRGGDRKIVSGESGASAFGCLNEILTNPGQKPLKEELGIGSESVVLCFSTEGATDMKNYKKITGDE